MALLPPKEGCAAPIFVQRVFWVFLLINGKQFGKQFGKALGKALGESRVPRARAAAKPADHPRGALHRLIQKYRPVPWLQLSIGNGSKLRPEIGNLQISNVRPIFSCAIQLFIIP